MTDAPFPRRWWLAPLLSFVAMVTAVVVVCKVSDTAGEVLAKAVMTMAGAMATPFILETTVALVGLVIVIAINQWRLQKEGDGWVYLAQTNPDPASVEAGADTASKRLEGVVMPVPPDREIDLNARLAIAEGYLELGLKQEALDHVALLSEEEQKNPRAEAVKIAALG